MTRKSKSYSNATSMHLRTIDDSHLLNAGNVPQCALAIEEIFCRAGFDEGIFQTLLIDAEQVEKVIVDSRVTAVTLTGSEKAGSAVASIAARHIKKSVLELTGAILSL